MIMKNIFPLGNGGFGEVSKNSQHKQEDSTAQVQAVVPTRNHNFSYQAPNQIGQGKRMNNNPWGDRLLTGPMYHPLISVPPPSLEQSAWAWAQSSQYPVSRFNNDLTSFSCQPAPGTSADQKVFDSSHWSRQRSGGAAESVCYQFNLGQTCESTTLSPSLSPGERKVVKKRTSGELLRLLDKKEYETDRLKKAEERAEKLAREEEEVEKEKIYKLKTELRRLEEKRKHQEWETYQRQERLIRKKEKLNGPVRGRSRSGGRSRSVYPQRRRSRSRSRSRSNNRSRQKSVAARNRRNTSRSSRSRSNNRSRQKSVAARNRRNTSRSSRSRSRVSFRRASFTSRKRDQSRSPGRRILLTHDQDHTHRSINENLLRLAGERQGGTDPGTERYDRTMSPSPETRRGKSKCRQERRNCEERTVSRSPRTRRPRYGRSGTSARERDGARGQYRSRSRERSRTRARSRTRRCR